MVSVRQSVTDYPGSIYVTLELPAERRGGLVNETGDALAKWLPAFLAGDKRSDLRRKLGRTAAQERHAVVILAGFDFAVTDVLMRDDAPLPVEAPDLPAEVTHVWALSPWSSGRGMRWPTETGWRTFAKTAPAGMPPS